MACLSLAAVISNSSMGCDLDGGGRYGHRAGSGGECGLGGSGLSVGGGSEGGLGSGMGNGLGFAGGSRVGFGVGCALSPGGDGGGGPSCISFNSSQLSTGESLNGAIGRYGHARGGFSGAAPV